MKHRLGNNPKCIDCYWYREKQAEDKNNYNGWCVNKHNCSHGINGRKRITPLEREKVRWNWSCHQWEDAENRLTHYEVMTRTPGEWRTETEKDYIRQILGGE